LFNFKSSLGRGDLASVASDALKGFERLKNTFNLIVEDWMPQNNWTRICKAIKINYSIHSFLSSK
jgi:hypothetical protein